MPKLVKTSGINNARLLSIYSDYVDRIKDGTKTFELRSYDPKILPGYWVIVYEPKPVQHISCVFQSEYFWCMKPDQAWETFNHCFGIDFDRYSDYFNGKSYAYGVKVGKVKTFDPIPYQELVNKVGFNAPQGARSWSYDYIDSRILEAISNT